MRKLNLAIMSVLALSVPALAELTPEERGLEIAQKVDQNDRGFGDSVNDTTMTLKDKYGNERPRNMRIRSLETQDDGDKSIVIFDNPGDVKGTAFLSHTHKIGSDDQWLYLPALKKVKRISSSNKAGAFMNSEFAYEDISSQEVEKYTYKFLKEDSLNGTNVFVNEADPVDPKSGYSKLEVYIDAERYIPLKIDFYDRGGRAKKTLTMTGYKQYLDKFWRAKTWSMQNHQTGKSTVLEQLNWKFGNGFNEKDFNKNSLSRVK
ncbi:MAG: outer membrane lipoprotein-sorting protein [Agarilytica sp.]